MTGPELSERKLLVGLDLLCLILASIPFFVCELNTIRPHRRGFICGDLSIMYPYLQSETIPIKLLIGGGITITGLSIALGECYRVRYQRVRSNAFIRNLYVSSLYKAAALANPDQHGQAWCGGGCDLTSFCVWHHVRLGLNCTPGTYVSTITCRQPDHRLEDQARKSFFSGHASFAMYTMLYLAFYLQARFCWRGARLLRPLLQFFLLLLAVFTGLTRISDYRHHPSDVITGYIQGALTAYWVAFYISSMFKDCSPAPSAEIDSPLSPHHTVC
ncbi:hypothetical protein UPYG_G00059300 [Umbra pygmaea]|uniref:Phosphatidic acid phosphatase type 2/haloperoxidase domain-containing protein n=1 Tax=Umbra pygmaea TaxID=75934 RepID=A0ABD0XWD8_UMBPY